MPSLQKKPNKEQLRCIWNSVLPWSTRLKGKLWLQLRFVWLGLMVLTVLCVAIQILGVVRQSRNFVLKQSNNEDFFNMRFTIDFKETLTTPQRSAKQGQSDHKSMVRYFRQWSTESTTSQPGQSLQTAARPGELGLLRREIDLRAPGTPERERQGEEAEPAHVLQAVNPERTLDKMGMVTHSQAAEAEALPRLAENTVAETYSVLDSKRGTSVRTAFGMHRLPVWSGKAVAQQPWEILPTQTHHNTDPWATKGLKSPWSATKRTTHESFLLPRRQAPLLQTTSLPTASRFISASTWQAACQPKTHIVFLKTHKTASSTILNILYRYGDSRNLTFALPVSRYSQLFYPNHFIANFVEGIRTRTVNHFDIMCNHMRFLAYEVKKVMPADTFYFSILRNPVSMMESIFSYYKGIPAFNKARNLDEFLDNPLKFFNHSLPNNHYAQNLLSFDFGFVNSYIGGDKERQSRISIAQIENHFDLILISEYFDESMILLKNALCWTLDDVVSFRLNSRSDKTRQRLSLQTMEKIKAWNSLDWSIYVHFNTTFWKKIDMTVGREEMKREVARLRQRRELLMKICLTEEGAVDPSQVKDNSLKPFQYGAAVIQGYNLNPRLVGGLKKRCQDLITPELQYTSALYDKQFPELAAKFKLLATKKQVTTRQAIKGNLQILHHSVQRRSMPRGPRHQGLSVHHNAPNKSSL